MDKLEIDGISMGNKVAPDIALVGIAPVIIGIKGWFNLVHFRDESRPVCDALGQPEALQLIQVFCPGNNPVSATGCVFVVGNSGSNSLLALPALLSCP